MTKQLRSLLNWLSFGAEWAWMMGFALYGRLVRPSCQWWSSPGNQRVLVIAPHPDDEAIGCAGTLLRHRQAGDTVHLLYVTDGGGSRAMGLGSEEMVTRRREEAGKATRLLGATYTWLGLPENSWQPEQLQPHLVTLLNQWNPHLIYAPSCIDFHPEHHKTAYTLAISLGGRPSAVGGLPLIRIYQIQVPLTSRLVNLVSPIGEVRTQSTAVIEAHATQLGSTARTRRLRRYTAAFYGCPPEAEAFWQLPSSAYSALHTIPLPWPQQTFRSLRPRPFTDPLAYGYGRSARSHLLERIMELKL